MNIINKMMNASEDTTFNAFYSSSENEKQKLSAGLKWNLQQKKKKKGQCGN